MTVQVGATPTAWGSALQCKERAVQTPGGRDMPHVSWRPGWLKLRDTERAVGDEAEGEMGAVCRPELCERAACDGGNVLHQL